MGKFWLWGVTPPGGVTVATDPGEKGSGSEFDLLRDPQDPLRCHGGQAAGAGRMFSATDMPAT